MGYLTAALEWVLYNPLPFPGLVPADQFPLRTVLLLAPTGFALIILFAAVLASKEPLNWRSPPDPGLAGAVFGLLFLVISPFIGGLLYWLGFWVFSIPLIILFYGIALTIWRGY